MQVVAPGKYLFEDGMEITVTKNADKEAVFVVQPKKGKAFHPKPLTESETDDLILALRASAYKALSGDFTVEHLFPVIWSKGLGSVIDGKYSKGHVSLWDTRHHGSTPFYLDFALKGPRNGRGPSIQTQNPFEFEELATVIEGI